MAGVGRLPQVVFPVARVGGAPVALSLIGPSGSDLSLIRLARDLAARIDAPLTRTAR